jgi:4-amino-4-deoxy-L-arabinose transferase-like glycosyltransferase
MFQQGQERAFKHSPTCLLIIFSFALALRAIFLLCYKMIDTDSAYYASVARFFAEGHWQRAVDPYWPPFYPFLTSLIFRLKLSLEASGIAVSLLASAGTVIICYFLAKLVAGSRVGIMAACIAAIHPRLIAMSQTFLTEPLFSFLTCSGLSLFCYALGRERQRTTRKNLIIFLIIGIIFSLAFLTRPEGIFYFLLLLVLIAVHPIFKPASSKGLFQKSMNPNHLLPFLMLAGFAITSSFYFYNVYRIEGRLTLGEKAEANFYIAYRNNYIEKQIPVEASGYDNITGPDQPRKSANYHLLKFVFRNPEEVIKKIFQNIPRALLDKIPSLMYWPLTLFSLFGLLFRKKINHSHYDKIYALWILVPVIIYSPLFLYRRFFSPTLPILITWCAFGFEELRYLIPRKFFSILLCFFVIILLGSTYFSLSSQSWPILYKEAGLWLKEHASKPIVTSGRKPETSFYAEGEFRPLKAQGTDDLLNFLTKEGVTHLIVEDYILPMSNPGLIGLLDPKNAPPWLRQVYSSSKNGHKLIVYEFHSDKARNLSPASSRKDVSQPAVLTQF